MHKEVTIENGLGATRKVPLLAQTDHGYMLEIDGAKVQFWKHGKRMGAPYTDKSLNWKIIDVNEDGKN